MTDETKEEEVHRFVRDFDLITTGRYSNPKQSLYWILKERRAILQRLTDEKRPDSTKIKNAAIDVWAAELLQWTETPPTIEALQGAAVTVEASIGEDWTSESQLLDRVSGTEQWLRAWLDDVHPGVSPEELPTWGAQKHQMDKCLWWANLLLEAYRRGWTAAERPDQAGQS